MLYAGSSYSRFCVPQGVYEAYRGLWSLFRLPQCVGALVMLGDSVLTAIKLVGSLKIEESVLSNTMRVSVLEASRGTGSRF